MTIGARVKALRKSRGLSQVSLSKQVKISQAALSLIEVGEATHIRGTTLIALAKALGTNPHWLETGQGSPAPNQDVTIDHSEVIILFDHLNEQNRNAWMTTGRALLSTQQDVPASVQPYKASKKLPA